MNDFMLLLQNALEYALKEIKEGRIYVTEQQVEKASKWLSLLFSPSMNRLEVLEELGICDTTLRKRIKANKIPRGCKMKGVTSKKWTKTEIENLKCRKCDN